MLRLEDMRVNITESGGGADENADGQNDDCQPYNNDEKHDGQLPEKGPARVGKVGGIQYVDAGIDRNEQEKRSDDQREIEHCAVLLPHHLRKGEAFPLVNVIAVAVIRMPADVAKPVQKFALSLIESTKGKRHSPLFRVAAQDVQRLCAVKSAGGKRNSTMVRLKWNSRPHRRKL